MMRKRILFIALFCGFSLVAQTKKALETIRIEENIKVDGNLDESIWSTIPKATDFLMFQPDNGLKEPNTHKTEVQIAYDDVAIYIGARLFDSNPNNILKEFSQRDNIFVEADVFTVAINTFNDGINEYKFYVTSAGTQADSRTLQGGRRSNDFNWSAVWESATATTELGWVVEIKIPYSALRFQNTDVQTWGVNFLRDIKSRNETYSWNLIDRSVGRQSQYNGTLHGIKNIEPPLRLSFFPFISGNVQTTQEETESNINAGLDVKYGISESFTLDATVIPDFSQTGFDPLSLNLGPFEQTFREQRQFFTEGVALFNKGNLFFSRRIGGRPISFANPSADEDVIDEPEEVKVLNVFKISGRTKNGLGIGFLNAVTNKTEATLRDNQNNTERKEIINPLTNYNVLVLDQQFGNNSSISLVNTHVLRNGFFRDANATALVYDINTKTNTFNISGDFKYSTINDVENINGFSSSIDVRKTAGNLRYGLGYRMADDSFEINDLGRQRRNNFSNFSGNISYEKFTPEGRFNNYSFELFADLNYLYKPNKFSQSFVGMSANFTTKNQLFYRFGADISPSKTYDYFEARTPGRVFVKKPNLFVNSEFATDNGKKISSSFRFDYNNRLDDNQKGYSFSLQPQLRLSNKFKINYSFNNNFNESQPGYVTNTSSDILFGRRDVKEIENSLRFTYNHNTNHAVSLNFRSYWSTVQYKNRFFTLAENGMLNPTQQQPDFNADTNFNVWNLDLNYSWQFAPGSQVVFLYRNSIFQNTDQSALNYLDSVDDLLKKPMTHIFSLKITYFIDYLNLENMFKKKTIAKVY